MITRLYLDNMFKHFDQTFTFENGLTGVIGPNESGKSLIVEAIRYALFGSAALRGKSEDYKKLHVELDFTVQGESFTVLRKGAKMALSGDRQASGTKPVNAAIKNILGYDLKVFDVANACTQGNIEALSEMGPAERKAMVDQVVGLNVLDDLISFAGQEGNALKREAEGMAAGMTAPVEPVELEDYRASTEIPLAEAEEFFVEYNKLSGFLSSTPEKPKKPKKSKVSETVEHLEGLMEDRKVVQRSIKNLESKLRFLEPAVVIDVTLDDWDQFDAWTRKQKLLSQGHHECPECSHQWPVADLGDVAEVVEVTRPAVTRQEIKNNEDLAGNDLKIAEIEHTLDELEVPADRSECLEEAEARDSMEKSYNRSLKAFHEFNEGLKEKQERLEELKGADEVVFTLRTEMQITQQYERDLKRFEAQTEAFSEKTLLLEDITSRSEDFLKARDAIKALKVAVKTHLLPSLNKVASVLLSQMTGVSGTS